MGVNDTETRALSKSNGSRIVKKTTHFSCHNCYLPFLSLSLFSVVFHVEVLPMLASLGVRELSHRMPEMAGDELLTCTVTRRTGSIYYYSK